MSRSLNQDGYTLAEVLVALFVISLAMGGLTEGARFIGRLQTAAGRSLATDSAQAAVGTAFTAVLEGEGPFASSNATSFSGDEGRFQFTSAAKGPCEVVLRPSGSEMLLEVRVGGAVRRLRLPGVANARFSYAGSRTLGGVWPALSQEAQILRSVSLVAVGPGGETAIAGARVWREQIQNCYFDAIAQACRSSGS
jgi:prepilin-type N-terminal cleavage/methylation domain-containing protein